MLLMEACFVATQGTHQTCFSGNFLLGSPCPTSWDFGPGASDGSMESHIDVVLAKVVELVDDGFPVPRVALGVTLILMA